MVRTRPISRSRRGAVTNNVSDSISGDDCGGKVLDGKRISEE